MLKPAKPTANDTLDLGQLIERLGPLNNQWRAGNQAEKALTLWEMGEVLLKAVANPSDKLLWDLQGRSYLTRNTLRYALIVRRGWPDRHELATLLSGLQSYTVFREALPFLKGDREGIDEAAYQQVIVQLRNPDTQAAIAYLKKLKAKKIGRKQQRGISAIGVQEHAHRFRQALAELETAAGEGTITEPAALVHLSQLALAIATDEPITSGALASVTLPERLCSLAKPLRLAVQSGRPAVAAFRKAVGAERLMQAADLLNSLRSAETLAEWQRRRGVKLLLKAA